MIAIDVETTGLSPRRDKLHGLGVATKDGTSYRNGLDRDGDYHLIGHNLRFDLKFLKWEPKQQIWDTKLLAQLINENQPLGLKDLVKKYLGEEHLVAKQQLDSILEQEKLKNVAFLCQRDLDEGGYTQVIADYCEEDCSNTLKLFHILSKELKRIDANMKELGYKKTPLDYYLEEAMPLEKVLLKMENRGIKIDLSKLQAYKEKLLKENEEYIKQLTTLCQDKLEEIEGQLYRIEVRKRKSTRGKNNVKRIKRFNWKSGDHLGKLIYQQYRVGRGLVKRTKTGKYNTAEKQLKTVQSQTDDLTLKTVLELYLAWKKNLKLLTTYTGEEKGLLRHVDNGRVYGEYLQAGRGKEGEKGGTVTGRLSSRSPNMQNLPRDSEVKSFFIPDSDEHVFVYFDYNQLELRLAAHLSQDPLLLDAYRGGFDLHQITADKLGIDRQLGKKINFAMIYNASPWRLLQELGDGFTEDDCFKFRKEFFALYEVYENYLKKQRQFMVNSGVVISETGRVRRLPALREFAWDTKEYRHAINQGYNFPIQSLGASITKRAMIALDKAGFELITQVHDSVVLQLLKKDIERALEIKRIVESVYPIAVPLVSEMRDLKSLDENDIWRGDN